MSRMRALGIALSLSAVVAVTAGSAQAQQTEEALIQRLQELQPQLEQAQVEAQAATLRYEADLRASQETTVDTFRVGPLTVVAPVDQVEDAREMYGRIWEEEYAPFVTHSAAIERNLFTYSWSAQPPKIVMTGPHKRAEARFWNRRSELERRVREAIGRTLDEELRDLSIAHQNDVRRAMEASSDQDAARALWVARSYNVLYGWTRGALVRPENPEWLYRQIATTPAKISRDCLDAVPLACWTALGVEVDAESFERWYTPDERRELALRATRRTNSRDEELQRTRKACEEGHLDLCDEILGRYSDVRSLIPVIWDGRSVLLWVALEMGGEGAWDRLVEDYNMPPADALLYASGATREELEARWREIVLESKPEVHAGLSTTKWMVLFWILVFTAFAMRSTRWRLG